MVKVTVNYNKLFEFVPQSNPKPNYEVLIEESDLHDFIGSLDLKGVETINISFKPENGEA